MPKQAMTLQARQKEFPKETTIEKGSLMCVTCHCPLPFDKRHCILDHFASGRHQKLVQAREKSGQKQPSIIEAVRESNRKDEERTDLVMQLVEACLSANISLNKINHPATKNFLQSNVPRIGLIPSANGLRQYYAPAVFRAHKTILGEMLKKCNSANLVIDESPDFLSRKVLNVMLVLFTPPTSNPDHAQVLLLDCVHLDEINFKSVSEAVDKVLKSYDFDYSKINAVISDNASYMTKAYNEQFRLMFRNSQFITCTAHIFDLGIQNFIAAVPVANAFVASAKMVFSRNSSDRKLRFKARLKAHGRNERLPPEPDTNRWNSWLKTALIHAENWSVYASFFTEELATHKQSKCLQKVVELLADDEVTDTFADIALVGEHLMHCMKKNEGVYADVVSKMNEVDDMLYWCRNMRQGVKTESMKEALGGYAEVIHQYFHEHQNRYRQQGAEFMCAVRALDPAVLITEKIPKELLFEHCQRFKGEELKFGPEIDRYYDLVERKVLRLFPNEHAIDFWYRNMEKFPTLAPAAIYCLSIVCNSVTVERSFSHGRDVLTKKRNRLSSSNVALYNMLFQNYAVVSEYSREGDKDRADSDDDSVIVEE